MNSKNKIKVLLVVPVNNTGYQIIPDLGIGYLCSALKKSQISVSFLDCPRDGMDLVMFERYLRNNSYDLIGMKVYSDNVLNVKESIKIVKNINSKTIVVLGGPHPSSDPQGVLPLLKGADYAFLGEAEVGFPKLIKAIENKEFSGLGNIPGLIWRKNEEIVINDPIYVEPLDSLEFPDWNTINPRKYPDEASGIFVKSFPVAPIIASRGCPFKCSFCAGPKVMGKRIRYRSVENVIDEIILLKEKYGINDFTILDDNFTGRKAFVVEFCNNLIKRKIKINWSCPNGVRLDSLDEEMLKLMEKTGCYSFGIGVESGSNKILRHMGKSLTIEKIIEKVKLIKDSTNISITGFFIMGYPEEKLEDIQATLELSRKLKIDQAHFCIFIPLFGTPIFSHLQKEGLLSESILDFNTFTIDKVSMPTKYVDKEKIKKMHKQAYLRFYLRPKIILNSLKQVKSFGQIKVIARRLKNAFS